MTAHICHNPACHAPVNRGDALLRSVSLVQVAFCSPGCVRMFDTLDKAERRPVPEQRKAVVSVARGRMEA